MLKNAYILEKDVKIASASGAPPRNPVGTLALLLPAYYYNFTTLSSSFLALNLVYYLQKRTNFASSNFLQLLFISNSVVFVDRVCKNISCPRVQGILATPLPGQATVLY